MEMINMEESAITAPGVLEQCRGKLRELIAGHQLDSAPVTVLAKPLTPEEAIGTPGRRDYPILEGKERVIEATVLGARGQAFTDSPSDFVGQLSGVVEMPLTSNQNRAIFLATMNAVLSHMRVVEGTVHCKNDAPEKCAAEIAASARQRGAKKVGLIGFNPSIAEALAREFGAGCVCLTDLNPQNIGTLKFGVMVWDGRTQTHELVRASDLLIVTGTTLVNGTFDEILRLVRLEGKQFVVFGITAAGVCRLMGLERWCSQAQNG
jgi:phosphohistidine phosphatase SixA